jgi:hypothetical protein
MKSSRFSAVELVRFVGSSGQTAFETRFVAGAERSAGVSSTGKTALAGVEDFVADIVDDDYRHSLQDLFDVLVSLEGLTVFWGTSGCSLRVAIPNRSPLSIGWLFPPGPARWMGLTDVTLGWYEDANGLVLSSEGRAALTAYLAALNAVPGGVVPKPSAIQGRVFKPADVVAYGSEIAEAVRHTVAVLTQSRPGSAVLSGRPAPGSPSTACAARASAPCRRPTGAAPRRARSTVASCSRRSVRRRTRAAPRW